MSILVRFLLLGWGQKQLREGKRGLFHLKVTDLHGGKPWNSSQELGAEAMEELILLACSQAKVKLFSLHSLGPLPKNGTAHSGLGSSF